MSLPSPDCALDLLGVGEWKDACADPEASGRELMFSRWSTVEVQRRVTLARMLGKAP